MRQDGEHPCGALPVSGWSVSVWYCHMHQAYFASHDCYTQSGEDVVHTNGTASIAFGPFDSSTDVLDWIASWTPAIALLPTAEVDRV